MLLPVLLNAICLVLGGATSQVTWGQLSSQGGPGETPANGHPAVFVPQPSRERPLASLPRAASTESAKLRFIENCGQWPSQANYVARLPGLVVAAEPDAVVVQLADPNGDTALRAVVRFEFGNAPTASAPRGEHRLPGIHNFLIGDDAQRWVTRVPAFARVRYPCILDGVDLLLRDEGGSLEYDLEVDAGVDLSQVIVGCRGAERLTLDDDGALLVHTALGVLRQSPPRSEVVLPSGERRSIVVRFRILDADHFGFEAPDRDAGLFLRIDPGLVWSTFLGSSGAQGASETVTASAVDSSSAVTVVGYANGFDFPTTSGAMVALPPGGNVAFVSKFDAAGTLVYSSTVGSQGGGARAMDVALDAQGRATVAGVLFNGTAFVSNFPTTPGAFDTHMDSGNRAGFAMRLSPLGDSLVYSTFIEGSIDGTEAQCLTVSSTGSAIIGGYTTSTAFPVTPGAFKTSYASTGTEGFVTRLNPTGSYLEWSTFIGGVNDDKVVDLQTDSSDRVMVLGFSRSADFPFTAGAWMQTVPVHGGVIVGRLNSQGSAFDWVTAFAGSAPTQLQATTPVAFALEPDGGVVFVGMSSDPTLPTTPGALFTPHAPPQSHAFVARMNSTGSTLIYSTCLSYAAIVADVVVDASGVATVAGFDIQDTMPTTPGAFDATHNFPDQMFVTRIGPLGDRMYYSTLFGGAGWDTGEAISNIDAHRIVLGGAGETGIPITPGAFSPTFHGGLNDAYVATLDLFLQGIRTHGSPTAACRGPLSTNATRMPVAGDASFGFYCSGAPPSSTGWLLLGTEAPSPLMRGGAAIWLDVTRPIRRVGVQSDAHGFVERTMPLSAISAGTHFAAQFVFRNTATCTGTGALSASHALLVDVQ